MASITSCTFFKRFLICVPVRAKYYSELTPTRANKWILFSTLSVGRVTDSPSRFFLQSLLVCLQISWTKLQPYTWLWLGIEISPKTITKVENLQPCTEFSYYRNIFFSVFRTSFIRSSRPYSPMSNPLLTRGSICKLPSESISRNTRRECHWKKREDARMSLW